MTSPRNAVATDKGRFYDVPGFGNGFISVTNVLGVISAPAIINSAAKRAAECAYYEQSTWQAIEAEEGADAALRYIKEAAKRYMMSRGELGTAVHHACEHLDRERAPEVEPFVAAYERWLERDKPEIVAQEVTVIHPERGYAGTADLIVRMDGKTYIADIKTGFVAKKAALQMCAYANATHYVKGDASAPVPWKVDGAFVIDLKAKTPRGEFKIQYCDVGPRSWRSFCAVMEMWSFEQRNDVFGGGWK